MVDAASYYITSGGTECLIVTGLVGLNLITGEVGDC